LAQATREVIIDARLAYAEQYLPEDEIITRARQRGQEFGAPPVASDVGAMLRFLAAVLNARTVVEVGSGCGASGIWLLRGMRPDGVLTSVDVEPEHQRQARAAYTEAGFGSGRTRLITGQALDVLPRLTDNAYDLIFCDAIKQEYPDYLVEAIRLLRPGGVVVFDNAFLGDRVIDATRHDHVTAAVREVARSVRDDERLVPLMLPIGDGLLAAVKYT
jgi:predicted O-methyltransferase YrrM